MAPSDDAPPAADDRYVIASDVGGTFTDTVVLDRATGRVWTGKVPSRRRQQEICVANGAKEVMAASRDVADAPRGPFVVHHGSTVATNALLERRVARTAFVTNEGFEDLLVIRRQNRPSLYDLSVTRPEPLVPESLRFGVPLRRGADGTDHGGGPEALASALDEVAARCRDADVEAVAVGLLHADLYPEDERAVVSALTALLPGLAIVASHEVWPEPREVERFETTVLNAALTPVMGPYLGRLQDGLASVLDGRGGAGVLRVMDSAGVLATAEDASHRPASLLLSGPAGGVAGAAGLGRALSRDSLVTFDVGGTSTDVALVLDGAGRVTHETVVGGFSSRFPAVDVHTLGAGGGSVLWKDDGGHLQVGPRSQGARPGPACYGNGGDVPTLTDALLLAGRLPDGLTFGGRIKPDRKASFRVMERLASSLRQSLESTVLGAIRIAATVTAGGVQVVTTHRGHDPRGAALVAFGGAGPLLACELADSLGMREVLVPWDSGTFSARGMCTAPVVSRGAVGVSLSDSDSLDADVRAAVEEADPGGSGVLAGVAAMRYVGQSYELDVPVDLTGPGAGTGAGLVTSFQAMHDATYGHRHEDRDVEVVRVVATRTEELPDPGWTVDVAQLDDLVRPKDLAPGTTLMVFDGQRVREVSAPVLWRAELSPGQALPGPLVVADATATTYVAPDWSVSVEPATRTLVLTRTEVDA